ncbi:MAG: polyprenyl synthetase family protein [Streptosporangiaceae bacterium]
MNSTVLAEVKAARVEIVSRVEERLATFLEAERAHWATVDALAAVPVEAVAALVAAGGKRLRPAFCVSGFLAAGGRRGDALEEIVVDAAAGLELIHVAALIHDDILDASELRRGAQTVHVAHGAAHTAADWQGEARRYGEGVGILAGDLADVYADRLSLGLTPQAREIWGTLRTEIVVGQFLDVAVAAQSVSDPELARWIAVCKSGRYSIHRPLVLGAVIAGRDDLAPAFAEYGEALGEAFQLRDDLIDVFGSADLAGKPVGHDFEQHKMTLLLTRAVQLDPRVRELVAGGSWDPSALRELLVEIGVVEGIERHIAELVGVATAALDRAPLDQSWRDELGEMALEVAYRDH